MSNLLHKVVELTDYQETQIDFNNLRNLGYDTVILEAGQGNTVVSQDYPIAKFETHYTQAKAANFNVGFYFWWFNNVEPQKQAQEFYNLLVGKETNCKFIFDVESGSIIASNYNGQSIDSLVQETVESLKNIFKQNGLILEDNDFIIYSSRSFAVNNLINSLQKYDCWIAVPTGTPPTYNETISYQGYTFNWVGCQWSQNTPISGVGQQCDLDVFKDGLYFDKPIIIGQTTGQVGTGQAIPKPEFKYGDFVKLKSNTTNFAPTLIPASDKLVKHTIKSIDGDNVFLNGISEAVSENDLLLISTVKPISTGNTGNNGTGIKENLAAWNNLSLDEKIALYIASFEGFTSIPQQCGNPNDPYSMSIGYGLPYISSTTSNYPNGTTTPEQSFSLVIDYIQAHKAEWDNSIAILDPKYKNPDGSIPENVILSLYNFAYQEGNGTPNTSPGNGGSGLLGLIDNINSYGLGKSGDYGLLTFGEWSQYVPGQPDEYPGIRARMTSEYWLLDSGEIYLGRSWQQLPSQYVNIASQMKNMTEYPGDLLYSYQKI